MITRDGSTEGNFVMVNNRFVRAWMIAPPVSIGVCSCAMVLLPFLLESCAPLRAMAISGVVLVLLCAVTLVLTLKSHVVLSRFGIITWPRIVTACSILIILPAAAESLWIIPSICSMMGQRRAMSWQSRTDAAFRFLIAQCDGYSIENGQYPDDLTFVLKQSEISLERLFPTATPAELNNLRAFGVTKSKSPGEVESEIERVGGLTYAGKGISREDAKKPLAILYTTRPVAGAYLVGLTTYEVKKVSPSFLSTSFADFSADRKAVGLPELAPPALK